MIAYTPDRNSCSQSWDILLCFRLQQVAFAGDIKVFLMVSMQEKDQDSLRFLWVANPHVELPEIITFRFTQVVFGMSTQPSIITWRPTAKLTLTL